MSVLRIASIVHPERMEQVPERRFELLPHVEATILALPGAESRTASSVVRRVSLPVRGSGRAARFPSLATALTLLDPAIVHLQADPDTALAQQVASLASKQRRFGLVLETEADGCDGTKWKMVSALRSRRVLASTGALVARSAGALTCMRRLGFRGVGIVAASGQEALPLPAAQEAKRLLDLECDVSLVLGWAGPADMGSDILDVFEALAACQLKVALVIVASGGARQDLIDRADALEILDRIRFVSPHPAGPGERSAPSLAEQPILSGAIDAMLLGLPRNRFDRIAAVKNVEFAQVQGIPVIYPQHPEFAEVVGAGGWAVPRSDPGLLARLMTTLSRLPALVTERSDAAVSHAAMRHSPEAAAADLDRAIHAVAAGHTGVRSGLETQEALGGLQLSFNREPSRT